MQSTGSLLETSFTCRKIAATLRHTKGPRIAVATERGHVGPTRRTPCGSFPCALGIRMVTVRSDGGGELLKQTTLHNLSNQSRRRQRRLLHRHVLIWPARMRLAQPGLRVGSNLQSSGYRLQIFSVRLDCRGLARSRWFERRAAESTKSNDSGMRKG